MNPLWRTLPGWLAAAGMAGLFVYSLVVVWLVVGHHWRTRSLTPYDLGVVPGWLKMMCGVSLSLVLVGIVLSAVMTAWKR